jgi:hypothetical protein
MTHAHSTRRHQQRLFVAFEFTSTAWTSKVKQAKLKFFNLLKLFIDAQCYETLRNKKILVFNKIHFIKYMYCKVWTKLINA